MATGCTVRKNCYFDSVFLMQVARRLSQEPGIEEAAALMGTEENKRLLTQLGLENAEMRSAGPNDLIIALKGGNPSTINAILGNIHAWLHHKPSRISQSMVRTWDGALAALPHANLATISVPADFAAREARHALERGLNVFLFSSNVPGEEELALKQYARDHGLILMGPDCGTAIIAGVGLGFSNAVRRGAIGVIGSTGTGLQEFSCLVHRGGSGISHAIGTGSRDLSDAVVGISTFSALDALEADPQTKIIVLLSKPPGTKTLRVLYDRLGQSSKPIVICLIGIREYSSEKNMPFAAAQTLDEAAEQAIHMATGKTTQRQRPDDQQLVKFVAKECSAMTAQQRYIRGVFAGGTFCYQSQQVLRDAGMVAHSNSPLDGMLKLADPLHSVEHTFVDMGDEVFTQGRPHPMIDARFRRERILSEANDPQVAVLLLDFILGYNASPDPVGDLLEAIAQAKSLARKRGGYLSVVASVCGTEEDHQDIQKQIHALEEAGVLVFPSNAQAARCCRAIALYLQQKGVC